MTILRGTQMACRSAWRYRLRAFLMMAGVMTGACSLTVLNAVGERTREETMKRFKNMLGTFDTVVIRPGAGRTRGMVSLTNVPPTLKFEDARALTELPEIKQVALLQNAFDIDVKYRDRAASPAVFGVSSNWLDLRGDEMAKGRFFSAGEERSMPRVAVLGVDAWKELFAGTDPIGQTIRIGDVPFQVQGILQSRGAGPAGASLDNLILIPVTTASRRLFNRDFLTMVVAQVRNPDRGDAAVDAVTRLLRQRHHVAQSALDDFTVTSPRAMMARVNEVGSTLSRILTGAAALAMGIGGVVIMSLMLIAVSERRAEIGVRRSVGAARADILVQFLMEAAVISTLGGLFGATLGIIFTRSTTIGPAAIPAAVAAAIGIVFGVYPAWKATRIDPVAALRA